MKILKYVNQCFEFTCWPLTWWQEVCVSVPNLKLFEPMQTDLWAKEAGGCPLMIYGKMATTI